MNNRLFSDTDLDAALHDKQHLDTLELQATESSEAATAFADESIVLTKKVIALIEETTKLVGEQAKLLQKTAFQISSANIDTLDHQISTLDAEIRSLDHAIKQTDPEVSAAAQALVNVSESAVVHINASLAFYPTIERWVALGKTRMSQ